jgi:hypothetical protein
MLRKQIMQECGTFNKTCSIYLPSINEYVYSPNDILNDCSPINTFSLKKVLLTQLHYNIRYLLHLFKKKKKNGVDFILRFV